MMNKRGQFYILAAIIIGLALSGVLSVKTYAISKSEPRTITDMGSELNEEGMRIVDYGIYNSQDLGGLLNQFDEEYAPYFLKKTQKTNLVFLYGDKTELYSVQYNTQSTGTISAVIGGVSPTWENSNIIVNRTLVDSSGDEVVVNILGKEFEFDLKDNEMFYFIITQEQGDETYVKRN